MLRQLAAVTLCLFFEDIPNEELLTRLGQGEVGIDLWGILAYTSTPTEVLRKYAQLMRNDRSRD